MQQILSVSQLTAAIKKNLESGFPFISVKGEISNFKEQSSGHLYFTLKDQEAQISAVLFRGNARDLKRPLKNGDQVVVQGELSVYAPRGNYQLIIRKLEHQGVGELLARLQALKEKLTHLGWFDKERKKPLPRFPRTIGVVTSPTGAVIQDILNILTRRFSGFHLILYPVKVQGEGAAEEIARAIEDFNRLQLADVLIVGRGGGSLEDLWAFNEERVAAAIHQSKIPIISAVGHETDYSISDFVADVRAPTPSVAAELVTAETVQMLQFLGQTRARLQSMNSTLLQHHRKQLEHFKRHPLLSTPFGMLEPHLQRIDDLRSDLALCMQRTLQDRQLRLLAIKKQMHALRPDAQIATLRQKLTLLAAHLRGIDPKNLLTKGYCILFQEKNDSVILSVEELKPQDSVRLQMHGGKAHLTVNGIEK